MAAPNRSPMRVLIRPPSSATITTLPPPSATIHHPPPPPPPSSLPPLPPPPSTATRQDGVVVVGFIGRRKRDVSQLINRIIDDNVFGSGDADVALGFEKTGEIVSDEVRDWFKQRQISYYHEEGKGVLYLQFCSTKCPVMEGFSEVQSGFDSVFEKQEFGDLQGMLFMFSVCHVVVFMQEGSRFDVQILKKFRVLQGAKHAMLPFIKPQTSQPTTSRSHTSPSSRNSPSSKNRSSGKSVPPTGRNASSVTLMSGLGSYSSLLPGQCTPVILFVFLDDISDPGSTQDDLPESTSASSSLGRPTVKGPGSIVVLSRPVMKSEGGFRKKLQSSLESQIRFSIKKCRVLSGSETGPPGSRSGPVSSPAPLFSLDASRAVLLLDRSSNQMGESLDFATSIVENILNGISTSDSLLLESHSQGSNKEDILSVKEFVYRQCDILRGRGSMVSNTGGVSGGSVGMVAVAAAAAAASVASGKPSATPELPTPDIWLSSSQTILHGLLSAKPRPEPELEPSKRRSRQRSNVLPIVDSSLLKPGDPLELAATYLDSSRGLNMKFSNLWCQRALPVAKDVYLNDLPTCYPTSQHEAHLSRALSSFKSIVRGPAVERYLKKLEDECTLIWVSGRQLCDAVSLTGKSCIHQRHDSKPDDSSPSTDIKPHSSGFVFLHACACGRTRKLLSDPFDFETANVNFSCFPECDKLLPTLHLPNGNTNGPIQSSSWSLIRIGGSRYYQPSKGLLQSGFSSTEKFLLKWKIFIEKPKKQPGSLLAGDLHAYSMRGSSNDSRVETVSDIKVKKSGLGSGDLHYGVEILGKVNSFEDNKSNSARALPSFPMKKPFSEVVAGPPAMGSGFPPLQSKKKASLPSENITKEKNSGETIMSKNDNQGSKSVENISPVHENVDENMNGDSFLHTGNLLTMNGRKNANVHASLDQVVVYIGFEHECPCGHRFILTLDHLKGLGSIYAADEESHLHSSVENFDRKGVDLSKTGKHGSHGKVHRHSSRAVNPAVSKVRNPGRSKEISSNGNLGHDRSGKEQNGVMKSDYVKEIEGNRKSMILEDDGNGGFPLLDRNIPLYLNCPHCQIQKNKTDSVNVKFAGMMSQLQRIFLVTPSFPVVLATCPVIQFEASCLPPSVADREQKLQFSLGCPVILPPESFLSLRLPFVYGVQLEDGSQHPLKPFENQPELTAWITKGTTLQVLSKGGNLDS